MLRKLVLIATVVLLSPFIGRAQTATVTGHVIFPSGSAPTNASICFSLQNFKPNLPRIISTGTLVQQQNWCITPAADGSFSVPIAQNDLLSPVGTFWRVDFLWNNIQQSSATYIINSSPYNLDTATPLSQTVPAGPNQIITQCFPFLQSTPASTWTITHNENDANVFIQTTDLSGNQIFADSVNISNPNVATITWISAQSGRALACHGGSVNIATNQPNAIISNATNPQTGAQPLTWQSDFTANTVSLGTFNAPKFSKSAAPCCSGFAELNAGLHLNSSLVVDTGAIINDTDGSFMSWLDGGFPISIQAGPRGKEVYPITSASVVSNVLTVTGNQLTAIAPSDIVYLSGFQESFLNGQIVTVASSNGTTQFTANFTHANFSNSSETQGLAQTGFLKAASTLNLPDIASGTSTPASGYMLGVTGATDASANTHNDCMFYSSGGVLNDSLFGCNTNITFPVAARFVEWCTSCGFSGALGVPGGGFSGNRIWTLPDATGNVVIDSATQTLSAKTLTNPTVTTGTFATPALTTPTIGGGSTINGVLIGHALALNSAFTGITGGTCQEQTLTLAGAATTGTVSVSPTATPGAAFQWSSWVSGSNTISVRLCNVGSTATPTGVTWNATVIQ